MSKIEIEEEIIQENSQQDKSKDKPQILVMGL
jgi:hypothetical protein